LYTSHSIYDKIVKNARFINVISITNHDMRLKNISVSESNYAALKSLGGAGESFNDVISDLIEKVLTTENPSIENNFKELRSERRPRNHAQTALIPANSDI
jgi:predicted CopG family antitoxin